MNKNVFGLIFPFQLIKSRYVTMGNKNSLQSDMAIILCLGVVAYR